ncbi:MAG: cell surface protein SprA, partial [Bacteroidia bacterium]|nr:cell surface protein SprA [Bacteroidia bacterium]
DVTLPLNSTLITGSQSLFGIKTKLRFGRATVTAVFSEQESETQNISVQGGAQTTEYSLKADDYEENKHFFLAQYFREHYEEALGTLPIITSNININKIEVWVTNIGAANTENRNIIAFADIGEYTPANTHIYPNGNNRFPDNESNSMLYDLDTTQIRNINTAYNYLLNNPLGFTQGIDFEKVENARKLSSSEFTYNPKLGFISLNTSLNSDQVLAVAFQYTVNEKVYQVGEFSDQGIISPNTLMVKLLRSTTINTKVPMWDLMMKNVYSIGAYQINREDFIMNILYAGNDNGVPTGYLTEGPEEVQGVPLVRVLNLDNLDQQLNPPHDGVFDFIDNAATSGGTVNSSNGRIFFTVLEPFGSYLRAKLPENLANKYCYDSLYSLTKTGARQYPDKNKFYIEGMYKSSSGSEIDLHAFNIPQGSVKVTAGGTQLTENVQYTVDYTLGRVTIIDEGILNSGTPINIALENNSMFAIQSQTLAGFHVDYAMNDNLQLGATLLNLHEKPLTPKTNYGDEPISNTIWGVDFQYQKEAPLLTHLVDKLPFYSTKAPSMLSLDGEFAHFVPGHSRAIGQNGTSYIDDFEGSKSTIDLKNIGTWFLASTPATQPEYNSGTREYGYKRAKLAWYIIDPLFYQKTGNLKPSNISSEELSNHYVRMVKETEVFPNAQSPNGQPMNLAVFNLAYYPTERGPYNFNVDELTAEANLSNPKENWGGVMRKIETTDFEATNVEYVEFWMMDPFADPDGDGP